MTKQEFYDRTMKVVSDEDFEIIHRIYLAAGAMDKDEFCLSAPTEIHKNSIVKAMLYHCEQLAKTVENLQRIIDDQANHLDAAVENMHTYRDKASKEEKKRREFGALLNTVVDNINLKTFPKLLEAFEAQTGKIALMRMRVEAGWSLDPEEVLYLIEHCNG